MLMKASVSGKLWVERRQHVPALSESHDAPRARVVVRSGMNRGVGQVQRRYPGDDLDRRRVGLRRCREDDLGAGISFGKDSRKMGLPVLE
jgi:hypothetical protein